MSDNNEAKYLQQLAKKVLAGKASDEEKLFLEEYYNAFEKHDGVHADLSVAELQQLQDSILEKINAQTAEAVLPVPPRLFIWKWAAAAAVLILLAGTTLMVFNSRNSPVVTKITATQPADILPGTNKAILTLDNGASIVLDDAQAGTLVQQDHIQVHKTKDDQLIYMAAKQPTGEAVVKYNTVTTPKGGQYQIVLPDGSKVWLNAASSIHFPTSFSQKQRVVSVTGEVYFEVAHQPTHPFIVNAGGTSVEVLGTHFNVMAYSNEGVVKTTLAQGSVKITDAGRTATLRPGEQVQLNTNRFDLIKEVDVEAELAWKNGLFYFKDAGIKAVMKQVERWYDVSVKFEGDIPEKQFNGKVPRNVTLSELMEILSFYDDMKCVIEGNTITIKR